MAKSHSRRWIIALAYALGTITILIAIPFFCYLLLRLDLSLKASDIGKAPLLDEPVYGRDIDGLAPFAPLKKESEEEERAAIKAMRQRYRALLIPSEVEEKPTSDWSGLRRWERQWTPTELPASFQNLPPALEAEINEVAAFVRRSDADFRFGVPVFASAGLGLERPVAFEILPDLIAAHFLRGVTRLEAGEPAKALEEVEALLNYGKFALRRPNLTTFELQRLAYRQAIRLIWEGLQRGAWTREELGILRLRLAYLQYFKGADEAMRGEIFYNQRLSEAEQDRRKDILAHLATYTVLRRDQKTYLQWLQPILTDTDDSDWVYRYALEDLQSASKKQKHRRRILAILADPVGAGVRLRMILQTQMLISAADTACALEVYRQGHGEFPDTLEALKERGIISELSCDPIGGDPLLYRRESDGGYLLWSLGWNLADDQGTTVFTTDKEGKPTEGIDSTQGDWLWKMPPPKK